ncbi:MAG: hypothetical protein JWQ87_3297 [Candidatus Sulfotelmatobacter sp.]|nr:hypothetical protein [Candidatus Sulfotelmatobacter sp.]
MTWKSGASAPREAQERTRALAPEVDIYKDFLMTKKNIIPPPPSDQTWVLSSLEPDQLVKAKKHPIPRRHLKGPELLILWTLRLYLLFMMAVVGYQVWIAAR